MSNIEADDWEDFIRRVQEFCELDASARPHPGETAVDFLNRCRQMPSGVGNKVVEPADGRA